MTMAKRHNVLYTSMSGDMMGGGQKSLLLLLERLDREKYRPFLICPKYGSLVKKAEKLGIQTALIPTGRLKSLNIFSNVSTVHKFIKFIRFNHIDLIHTDAPRQTFFAGLAAKITKRPLIWHVRISDPEKRLYDKILSSLSTKMIAVSEAAARRLQRVNKNKIVVIFNGINLNEYDLPHPDKKLVEEFGKEENCVFVGTASQLIPRKGYSILLQAASQVLQVGPNVKFVIVGSGEEKYSQSLYDLSKDLGITENIIFTGYREDISQIMKILDIVVLPSTHPEGFSRLLLEAMASSKPVVASRIGGNPEAVEDGRTGLIVPPGDVDSLAKALLQLVQNKELRQSMGHAGRQRVKEQFSIEINVSKIESIYEELLCRNM